MAIDDLWLLYLAVHLIHKKALYEGFFLSVYEILNDFIALQAKS